MSRGTWQGSGTWHTSGPDLGPLLGLAVVAVAAAAAAYAVVSWIILYWWLVLGVVVAVVVTAAIAARWLIRWADRRAAAVFAQKPLQVRAVPLAEVPPATPPVLESPARPAIEPPRNELHVHFHGMSPAEAAEAIRQAGERR